MSNLVNKVEINRLVNEIHDNNVKSGWWTDLETGESLKSKQGETPKRNILEMLCLIHSEISEAMEDEFVVAMLDAASQEQLMSAGFKSGVIAAYRKLKRGE